MPVLIRHGGDGSYGLAGDVVNGGTGKNNSTATVGFVNASTIYNVPAADWSFFVADRVYVVKGIRGVVDVAGSDGSAVTATIRKVPDGTALASGTALHTGTFNLKGTAATNQSLTLSATATDLQLYAGDRLAVDMTGTATAAIGAITVNLAPA